MMTEQNSKQLICPVCKVEHKIIKHATFGHYIFESVTGCPFQTAMFTYESFALSAMRNLIDSIDELENG